MPKYFKTTIVYEILTEGEPVQWDTLAELNDAVTYGHASGMLVSEEIQEVAEAEMRDLLLAQGSDPDFLNPGDQSDEC